MMSRILPFVFLVAAGGIFLGYIHPTVIGPIAETSKKIKQYDAALTAAARFEQKQNQLASELKLLPADGVTRLQEFLPDSVDNVQLILDLDNLASHSGVPIENFNTTELVKQTSGPSSLGAGPNGVNAQGGESTALSLGGDKPYDSLDLSITASGSYAQMRAFLDGVESSLRPLDLMNLQISDSVTGIYKYQMTFRLYWLR